MSRYRKKPVVIDAVRCADVLRAAERHWRALPEWLIDAYENGRILFASKGMHISTLEGFSGGLNLAAGPDAVSETEAIDLLNVMFTLKGAVKQGVMLAHPDDWIIRGVQGEIYPCKPDIFEATYEVAMSDREALRTQEGKQAGGRVPTEPAFASAPDVAGPAEDRSASPRAPQTLGPPADPGFFTAEQQQRLGQRGEQVPIDLPRPAPRPFVTVTYDVEASRNNNGREIGYGVRAVCDLDGCDRAIDRGLAYCCGDMDGANNAGMDDEPYCGGFFCGDHLQYVPDARDPNELIQVCLACSERAPDWPEEDETAPQPFVTVTYDVKDGMYVATDESGWSARATGVTFDPTIQRLDGLAERSRSWAAEGKP